MYMGVVSSERIFWKTLVQWQYTEHSYRKWSSELNNFQGLRNEEAALGFVMFLDAHVRFFSISSLNINKLSGLKQLHLALHPLFVGYETQK